MYYKANLGTECKIIVHTFKKTDVIMSLHYIYLKINKENAAVL